MFKKTSLASAILLAMFHQTAFAQSSDDNTEVKADNDKSAVEVIEVRGIKGSLNKALNIKRQSFQLVDAIVAEDIGKFPDNNVIESLQRVTGVQTTGRGSGEVSTVSIRGLTDVNTTVNGRQVFTGAGRSVALADIPASLLSSVEVFKTRSASQVENGIAGSIDIKTQRPFNFEGSKVVLAAKGTYQELRDKIDPNVSLLLSDRWEVGGGEFGALLNLSYAETNYRDMNITPGAFVPYMTNDPADGFDPYERIYTSDDRAYEEELWTAGLDAGLSTQSGATMDVNGIETEYMLSRDAIFMNDYIGTRKRPAANLSLQWAPSAELELVAEVFYNGYRNTSFNSLNFTNIYEWNGLGDGTLSDDDAAIQLYEGTNVVKSRNAYSTYHFTSGDTTKGKTDSWLYALGANWYVTDDLTLDSELVYQKSDYTTQFFAMRFLRTAYGVSADFNHNDGIAAVSFMDDPDTELDESDLTDINNWNASYLYDNGGGNSGDELTYTLDGKWALDSDVIGTVNFGFRADKRGAQEQTYSQSADGSGTVSDFMTQLDDGGDGLVHITKNFFDGRAAVPDSWAVANGFYIFDHADEFRSIYGLTDPANKRYTTYDIEETGLAAYASANYRLGQQINGEFGVRAVSYKQDMRFWTPVDENAEVIETTQDSATNKTTKVLPSLVVRWNIADDLLMRFAYTQTLRMPDFASLNPTEVLGDDVSNVGYASASAGNYQLKPTESTNYDLSLEWYFAEASSIYTTLFQRDIEGFVTTSKTIVYRDKDGDGEDEKYVMSSPQNASDGKLKGVELGLVYFPSNLPEVLDGLGVQASLTALDSSQKYPVVADDGETTGYATYDIYGVSDLSYSVVVAYDKTDFEARLSYVWRDNFMSYSESALFANPLAVYSRPEQSLDFQLSYDVTKELTVTFDATNLTDDVYKTYYGKGNENLMNLNAGIISRTFALGVRYRM